MKIICRLKNEKYVVVLDENWIHLSDFSRKRSTDAITEIEEKKKT